MPERDGGVNVEEWPFLPEVGDQIGIKNYKLRAWANSGRISAEKDKEGFWRIDPKWVRSARRKMRRNGEMILVSEACEILGQDSLTIGRWTKRLGGVQLAGSNTERYVSKTEVERVREEIEKIESKKLIPSVDVARELGLTLEQVRDYLCSEAVHPITDKHYYSPNIIEDNRDAIFVTHNRFNDLAQKCEEEFFDGEEFGKKITVRVGDFISRGRISAQQVGGKGSPFFIDDETANKIRNIYRNWRILKDKGIELYSVGDAVEEIGNGLDARTLNRLLAVHGSKFFLTDDLEGEPFKPTDLTYTNNGGKIKFFPLVPYLKWADFPNLKRYLTGEVVEGLRIHISESSRMARERRNDPFDAYWTGRLGSIIKAASDAKKRIMEREERLDGEYKTYLENKNYKR